MRDSVGDLVADGFDLALRFGEPPAGRFVAAKLVETRILTVAAPSYLAAHGRPAHPSEIVGHACIDFWDAANKRPYEWEFRKGEEVLPVDPRARLMTSDPGTMLDACVAGAGIAQIMQLGTQDWLAKGALVELFPGLERRSLSALRGLSFAPSPASQGAGVCRLRRGDDPAETLAARSHCLSRCAIAPRRSLRHMRRA